MSALVPFLLLFAFEIGYEHKFISFLMLCVVDL
uniref:Uncharacterized protein n=1 Tax=Rhizophora mucronata TaxID=61149 RepID=A0A2P2Q762_RHIMU